VEVDSFLALDLHDPLRLCPIDIACAQVLLLVFLRLLLLLQVLLVPLLPVIWLKLSEPDRTIGVAHLRLVLRSYCALTANLIDVYVILVCSRRCARILQILSRSLDGWHIVLLIMLMVVVHLRISSLARSVFPHEFLIWLLVFYI
jgi:hypothetical protein